MIKAMKFMAVPVAFMIWGLSDVRLKPICCKCGGDSSYLKIKCLKLTVQH